MNYTASTCLQCGEPFGHCICQQRFQALADPETAAQGIAAYIEATTEDQEEEGDVANLLLQVNALAQRCEFISLLSLCYDVGPKNGRGFPYVHQLQSALEALVTLGQIVKVDRQRYQAVPGAPTLAIA